MKLHIKNKIDLDGQVELVEQSYPVKLTEKNGHIYLTYTLTTIMLLHSDNPSLVAIPTPVGLQHLQTQTSVYELDAEQQYLKIHYQLKQVDGESVFANYQLEINWA